MKRRLLGILLAFAMLLSPLAGMTLSAAAAETTATFTDTKGHWASLAIERWSKLGVIAGYGGRFNPDGPMSRGDVAVMLGRLFGYVEKADNSFSDLTGSEYYAASILKAKAAGSMNGTSDTAFSPKTNLKRQQAAVLMCNLLDLNGAQSCSLSFADDASIDAWAKACVYALVNKGYLSGDGVSFYPQKDMTRAQFVTLLNNVFAEVISSGTFSKDIYGTVLVTSSDVTLRNMTINGDLVIAEGVRGGSVTLDNVFVTGKTIIRGGGNFVKVDGKSLLGDVRAERASGPVRIEVSDSAFIQKLTVHKYGGTVTLAGNYGAVGIDCQSGVLISGASVKSLTVGESAVVGVDGDSYVESAVLEARGVQLIGVGMVGSASVNADDAVILTSKTKVSVAAGVKGTMVAGTAVPGGGTFTSPDNTKEINESYTYTDTVVTAEIDWEAMGGGGRSPGDAGSFKVYFAVDTFILGNAADSFLINPVAITVGDGTNVAQMVTKALRDKGFSCSYGGSVAGGDFYLSRVGGVYGYIPSKLAFDGLPACLKSYLTGKGYTGETFFPGGVNDGQLKDDDVLSEFDYTAMSGWMYSVNGVYPNIGMGSYMLTDGDVVRLTFTLWGLGADIGGGYAAGGAGTANFYEVKDLTQMIKASAEAGNTGGAYAALLSAAKQIIK